MDRRKWIIILISSIISVLLLILLYSYLNTIDTSNPEWLPTFKTSVNVICGILLCAGLIISCMIYYFFIIRITDNKKQCIVNMSVFFSCLLAVILFLILWNVLKPSIDKKDSILVSVSIKFIIILIGVTFFWSICIMITVCIMSCFWCFHWRYKSSTDRTYAPVSQTNTTV
jgi:hypothetical protein